MSILNEQLILKKLMTMLLTFKLQEIIAKDFLYLKSSNVIFKCLRNNDTHD